MSQAIAPSLTLYERDLDLWLETAIAQLKVGDFQNLDVENLIEELEGLTGSHILHSFDESFAEALEMVRTEYETDFPNTWQFSRNLDMMLSAKFWESQTNEIAK